MLKSSSDESDLTTRVAIGTIQDNRARIQQRSAQAFLRQIIVRYPRRPAPYLGLLRCWKRPLRLTRTSMKTPSLWMIAAACLSPRYLWPTARFRL